MTYYRYNALTRILTAEPNYIVLADGATIVNPSAAQYAALRDAYQKGEDSQMPTPPEGKVVEYGGYELGEDDHLWHKQWVVVDAPPPPSRTFVTADVIEALAKAGVWPRVRSFLEERGMIDMVLATKEFSSDDPNFTGPRDALKELLGWTDEDVERILSASVKDS